MLQWWRRFCQSGWEGHERRRRYSVIKRIPREPLASLRYRLCLDLVAVALELPHHVGEAETAELPKGLERGYRVASAKVGEDFGFLCHLRLHFMSAPTAAMRAPYSGKLAGRGTGLGSGLSGPPQQPHGQSDV